MAPKVAAAKKGEKRVGQVRDGRDCQEETGKEKGKLCDLHTFTFTFTFTTIQARPLYEAYVLGSVSSDPTLLNRAATTPGTSCPTLFDECVGSLTSHRTFLELKEL